MRPADIFRRTSFRLAVGGSVVILLLFVAASTIGYGVMRRQMLARQDVRVTEIVAALRDGTLAADEQDLIEAVQSRIAASRDHATVYLLRGSHGDILAANMPDIPIEPGWSVIDGRAFGFDTDYPYRMFSGDIGAYRLVVGLSNADLDDLADIMAGAFGWTALFAFLATLGAAALIAYRVQTRITIVEAALACVAKGDLTARLPVTSRGDDLDRIAKSINQALARLGAQVAAMREVSDGIAHDLRTPLNRLRIRVEGAARKSLQGQPADDDLAAALAETDTIAETFSALLRIAQIEAGARREKFGMVRLAAVLADVGDAYAEVAEDAGMTLRCDTTDAALILGDRELLTQMFANLIENAIRHCPPGTEILCGTDRNHGRVTAFVRDTGPGIPAGERANVLRRLYRLEKSRTTEGSGLGLALVKAVADLHDADLTLDDGNPGLRITLAFPAPADQP